MAGTGWSRLVEGYASHADDMPHAEYVAWQQDVLRGCWETLTDDGAIYYNHKPLPREGIVRLPFELNPGLPLRQVITWDRGSGFTNCYWYYTPRYEWILLFAKEGFRLASLGTSDVWLARPVPNKEHPASFPIGLPKRALTTTKAGTVLDPFMGSGTTLRAAKDCNRKAIGIEIDERYCEVAARRLSQEVLNLGA